MIFPFYLTQLTTSLMTFVERPSNILLVLACLQTFLILGESDAPGIYIDRKTISNVASPGYFVPTAGYDYNIPWRRDLDGVPFQGAVSIYQLKASPYLSYTAEIHNFSSTGSILTFNPYGSYSQITRLSFNIIVLTSSTNFQLVQIRKADNSYKLCGWYTKASAQFTFPPSANVKVACWLQWVNYNFNGFTTLKFVTDCFLGSNSNDINYYICPLFNNGINSMIVDDFKVNVMVGSYQEKYPNVSFSKVGFYFSLRSSRTVGTMMNFNVNYDAFGLVVTEYNCIVGIASLYYENYQSPEIFFQGLTDPIIQFTIERYQTYQYSLICMNSCPQKSRIKLSINSYTCQNCLPGQERSSTSFACIVCREYIDYCHACTNQISCSSCYIGSLVTGGCTDMVGCTQIFQIKMGNVLWHACNKCNGTQFQLNSQSICQCKTGFTAGLHCTNETGCISTHEIDGKIQCISCDVTRGYSLDLSTYTCKCFEGFVIENEICVDVCGNGRVFDQMCDDGNTISGDGCSSTCEIERHYVCINGGPTSPSQCTYTGTVSVQLVGIRKVFTQNTGIFNYSVTPSIDSLFQGSYSSLFSFDCPNATYTVRSWTYTSGYLVMLVDYETDLEDSQAITRFIFNSSSISQPPIILNFTIKSLDQKLIYEDHQYVKVLQIVFKGLAFVALGILVCGSWMRRMVGVELLNVLQLIFFLHFTEENYTSAFGSIQQMSLACLSPLFINKDWAGFNFFGEYQIIEYSYGQARFLIVCISSSLACLSLILLTLYVISGKMKKHQEKLLRITKKIYDHILLPGGYFVFFPLFYLIMGNSNRSSLGESPDKIVALLKCLSVAVLGIIFGKEIKNGLVHIKHREQNKESRFFYTPIFTLYIFSQFICLFLWLKLSKSFCCYPLISISLFMLIWQILKRPYYGVVDNISIISNMTLATGFLGFLVLRTKGILVERQNIDYYACFIIAGFIGICEILSIVRIVIGQVQKCQENSEETEKIWSNSKRDHKEDRFHDYGQQSMLERFKSDINPKASHFVKYVISMQSDNKESFLARRKEERKAEQCEELKNKKQKLKKGLEAKRKKEEQQQQQKGQKKEQYRQ